MPGDTAGKNEQKTLLQLTNELSKAVDRYEPDADLVNGILNEIGTIINSTPVTIEEGTKRF